MKKYFYRIYLVVTFILLVAVLFYLRSFITKEIQNIPGFEKDTETPTRQGPARIVSLAPNITEILYELGLGDNIVAVSNNCDHPPQMLDKPRIGTFFKPSTEAIASHKPDLVITLWFKEQKDVAQSLNRLDIDTVTVKLEKIDELYPAIKKIGKKTKSSDKADALIKHIKGRINKISQKYQDSNRPEVLWLVQNEPIRAAGTKTFINEIIELAGGQNALEPTPMQYPQLGSENILMCKANVIIHSAMNKKEIEIEKESAMQIWKKFPDLPAVKEKRIHVIDPDTTLRLGPRLPQGIDMIASLIHPDEK